MKRSFLTFERRANETYDTPDEVVEVLHRAMVANAPAGRATFQEPCAGSYKLAQALIDRGHTCIRAVDPWPRHKLVQRVGLDHPLATRVPVITNPPYAWSVLKPLLDRWMQHNADVVLLLPLDMLANEYFKPYCPYIQIIVMVGRVRWIEGSRDKSKDNFAWVVFNPGMPLNLVIGRDPQARKRRSTPLAQDVAAALEAQRRTYGRPGDMGQFE